MFLVTVKVFHLIPDELLIASLKTANFLKVECKYEQCTFICKPSVSYDIPGVEMETTVIEMFSWSAMPSLKKSFIYLKFKQSTSKPGKIKTN